MSMAAHVPLSGEGFTKYALMTVLLVTDEKPVTTVAFALLYWID
jgi:hypothetical protein